ncbi:MAG: sugar phosphate isomerase/epimerase [Anaerolineae bacterium]|nr:sugar phosphate isomerase/epimerase [Anaerolineae bacterium]
MKLGFLTVGLSPLSLDEILRWGATNGFETVEIGCWPPAHKRAFDGMQLDVTTLTPARAQEIRALAAEVGLAISCLSYCDNNLASDPVRRKANLEHLGKVIDAAALLRVDTVCAFVGRDETKTIADNIQLAAQILTPTVRYAREKNVRIAIENCPMPGWQFEGLVGNVAHTPEVWDALFRAIPDENFGLNLDPSHLIWLEIDPIRAAREYASRTLYAHAKDTELVPEQKYRRGIMDPGSNGWRIYRNPGRGALDTGAFLAALRAGGYDGALSIEMEDPDWWGSSTSVQAGLLAARDFLRPLL